MSVTSGNTMQWKDMSMAGTDEPEHPPAKDAIAAEVLDDGRLRLRPKNALGALYLQRFGHGKIKARWSFCGLGRDSWETKYGPQKDFKYIDLQTRTGPLLSSGGVPYYTGMSLSEDERAACRQLVDEMRERTPEDQLEELGGGWYRLPNGLKVQGKEKALDALE